MAYSFLKGRAMSKFLTNARAFYVAHPQLVENVASFVIGVIVGAIVF